MARYERSIQIDAEPAVVWPVLADVDRWPEWTPTILSVARQNSSAFGLGSTAKVKAKGFPESVLTVTEFSPGRSFSWEGRGGVGLRVLFAHEIEPADGGSRVTLSVTPSGPAAVVVGWLAARLAKSNIDTEAESLKRRAEDLAR